MAQAGTLHRAHYAFRDSGGAQAEPRVRADSEFWEKQREGAQELQSAAGERALTPICLCVAWFAWASATRGVPELQVGSL